ncbi:hypothetical protein Efla_005902 [Eimeria flavescens]
MLAVTRLLGGWPHVYRAAAFFLAACLFLGASSPLASQAVGSNAFSKRASSVALLTDSEPYNARHMRQGQPLGLLSSRSISAEYLSPHGSPAAASPLAFTTTSGGLLQTSIASRKVFTRDAAAASATPSRGKSTVSTSGGDGKTFEPQKLEGRYCSSTSNTQRLPTRTVVVGGGAAGAEAFDLIHGQEATVQQRLLQEKLLPRNKKLPEEQTQELWRSQGVVLVGAVVRVQLLCLTLRHRAPLRMTPLQVMRCAAAGADMVRLTVQGPREADASRAIVEKLREMGCDVPLVADIHFQPRVASLCADVFDKVRVNPGNFADGRKVWEDEAARISNRAAKPSEASTNGETAGPGAMTPEDVGDVLGPWGNAEGLFDLLPQGERKAFSDGHRRIEETFMPLVEKCLLRKRALRIGTNHGSLSARVLRHFGDTPMGMVLSAVEFADICVRAGFYNFVFSLKSSNPVTMQHAYRLMAHLMAARGALFPLHLGVTEAGEGEDGRIKSAAGIGALLQDGIGDTIRASLTEPPWMELPVCRFLRRMQEHKVRHHAKLKAAHSAYSPLQIPPFEETVRNFAATEARARRRLGLHPQAATEPTDKRSQQLHTILHPDGTAIVAIHPEELLDQASCTAGHITSEWRASLYSALALRMVNGVPFRTPLSADAVYLRSLFIADSGGDHEARQKRQEADKKGPSTDKAVGTHRERLLKARHTLLQLQQAGLTVWADAREIQQVQMTREQLHQHLLQQRADPQQQRQMLRQLEEASLHIPGMVAVQRLQDAAAISGPLAVEYLKETAGLALAADGMETAEEFGAVVGRPDLLCVVVRPADRAASGVAAARRVSELLQAAERTYQASGAGGSPASVPIIQWIEEPPSELLAADARISHAEGGEVEAGVSNSQAMTMFAAWEGGSLLLDRLADGVLIDAPWILSASQERQLALDLLQGCRMRSTKTEYISCPSCGRTLFDIQKVSAEIRRRTGHLPGVKIAVMGCIVNGIGEMGDADFGYVGGAPGLVDLYVGKKLVRRGVKSAEACDALVDVIKAEGRWKEPEEVDRGQ